MKILTDPRSGSYQGITSSRNRFGQYVRTRAIPVQPRTPRQGSIRGIFGQAATRWRNLTDAQRSGWANMAANYSLTDSLGQTYTMTGFQFFQSAQLGEFAFSGSPWGDGAPSALADFLVDLSEFTIVLDTSAQTAVVSFGATLPSAHGVLIECTGPVSPGVTSPPGPHYWRQVTVLDPGTASGEDINAPYIALFGAIVTGQKVFFRWAEWDDDAARRSAWVTYSTIAVA